MSWRKIENSFVAGQPAEVAHDAEAHFRKHQQSIAIQTDRLLAFLLIVEWLAGIALAVWRSPLTWEGASSSIHPHILAAIFFGGAIITLPVYLGYRFAGMVVTRHTIAVAQMLVSALLIHLGDGRIEMHFHVFGSLAFLAFYRDWRVLATATIVVALDHLLGGIFTPASVYGTITASLWRTAEHAGWVIFEDIFLIGACVRGVREMEHIALHRTLLEHSHRNIERTVAERTAQLKAAQEDLLKTARTAGMAEIATSVLHNVGNVLNSVNVSATIVADKLRASELPTLGKVSSLMAEHQPTLGVFLTQDERGKIIPSFLSDLASCLSEEQAAVLCEVENLSKGIDHIKQIVAAQQTMAKKTEMRKAVLPSKLVESALTMQGLASGSALKIEKLFEVSEPFMLDEHKVLQILVNLISNAVYAVKGKSAGERRVSLRVCVAPGPDAEKLRFEVADNGMGIAADHLVRIFGHGFTTKQEGHGFGLHASANAAREMGGSLKAASAGPGLGSVFTLEIPAISDEETAICSK